MKEKKIKTETQIKVLLKKENSEMGWISILEENIGALKFLVFKDGKVGDWKAKKY